jgi:shikimate kinase
MNIVLIGYRGAGKTSVGSRLAARLEMKFVDTDDLIEERQGTPISDIVKCHGWEYFRILEKTTIKEITDQDHTVIAAGGGAVLDEDNVKALRRNGLIIWLKADQQALFKRMDHDPETYTRRPTLTGKGTLGEIEEVISAREPFYKGASEIQIDTSSLDVEAVVKCVLAIFNQKVNG